MVIKEMKNTWHVMLKQVQSVSSFTRSFHLASNKGGGRGENEGKERGERRRGWRGGRGEKGEKERRREGRDGASFPTYN
jgi:hypothetical protein